MKRTKGTVGSKEPEPYDDSFLHTFATQYFLAVNWRLIHKFGIAPAVFLSNLIEKFLYFHRKGMLKNGRWFFQSHERQMAETGIESEKTLRKYKQLFISNGILEVRKFGIPGKQYYSFNIPTLKKHINREGLDLPFQEGLDIAEREGVYNNKNLINQTKENVLKENPTKEKKPSPSLEIHSMFPLEWQRNREFKHALQDYLIHRKQLGKTLTPIATKRMVGNLLKYPMDTAITALNESVSKGWTGVFPESVRNSPTPRQSPASSITPQEILEVYFKKKLVIEQWTQLCFLPATRLMTQEGDFDGLAKGICRIADHFKLNQRRPQFESVPDYGKPEYSEYAAWQQIPSALGVVERYVKWLGDQQWIDDVSSRLFIPESMVFQKFLNIYQREVGRNFFTGARIE